MDTVDDPQELSFSTPPPQPIQHAFSSPPLIIRNGIRYNEFREILNTAVQATQHDRPLQRQPEVLGTFFFYIFANFLDIFIILSCSRYDK